MNSPLKQTKILSDNLFPVVGVGASAGGLQAFKQLIRAIPEDSGMAYILVQHLHPDHSSTLPEILQRETAIPVQEISNNVKVKPNNIYIIPSNKMLVATDGILQLSPRPAKKNMAIDTFFTSLAEVHKSYSIGIVLSGTGSDGTLGLQNIKDQGGITIAQDLNSAEYNGMPKSAINAHVADFILSPENMPNQLKMLNRTLAEYPSESLIIKEAGFKDVLALLRLRKMVDFTYYKQTTIRRRILRRMAIQNVETIREYVDYLKLHTEEQDYLFQDLLIPVTSFFRDEKIFNNLCKDVFPSIIKKKSSSNPLRIWIAGCSTGQEAYSMSMCLHEHLSDKISTIKIQIFATDISESSITKARKGLYEKRELEGVSEERIEQFFIKDGEQYQIKKYIREICVFANHNFLKDPPFANIDLLSCRNVLIYMEPFLQNRAFNVFHYALNDKGILLLGKSESTGTSSVLFDTLKKKEKIYIRNTLPNKFTSLRPLRTEESIKDADYGLHSNERKKDDLQKSIEDIILARYTPSGVLVNDKLDIVQFQGSTGQFLESGTGKASWNIIKMAREGLGFEIRNTLHKAKETNEPVTKENILINGGKLLVTLDVIPIHNLLDSYFLILFKKSTYSPLPGINISEDSFLPADESPANQQESERVKALEKDITQAREDMRSITEDHQAAFEELQSANEELLSSSEEMQSLNEELETSKEELQSSNEELITINNEMVERMEELNQSKLYAEAIVSTIHEPLLVLGKNLEILSANKAFYKGFFISKEEALQKNVLEIQDHKWDIPEFKMNLLKIQSGEETFIDWEASITFPEEAERTICFNAQPVSRGKGQSVILLAFNDISVWKEKAKMEKKNAADLKQIMEHLPLIASTASPDGTITYFNQVFLNYTGLNFDEAIDNGWQKTIKQEMLEEYNKKWKNSIDTGEDFNMELLLKRKSDNMYRWHIRRARALRNDDNVITGWVGATMDIHDKKTKEEAKDEFLRIASHELKTPLTSAKAHMQLLQLNMERDNNEDVIYAQKANASISRLENLIGELLDVSRIQNGKLTLNVSSFDFNTTIANTIDDIQVISPRHTIIYEGNKTLTIRGDEQRLQQVVINLLTNAIKYSPDSKAVYVTLVEESEHLKLCVKDSGIGIRKENLEKIFDFYYREEGRNFNFQGMGIGLAISNEIVQRHKGKIWAESEINKGSIFYLTIPVGYE